MAAIVGGPVLRYCGSINVFVLSRAAIADLDGY